MAERAPRKAQGALGVQRTESGLEKALAAPEAPKSAVAIAQSSDGHPDDLSTRNVRELQQIINNAFVALDEAAQKIGGTAVAPVIQSTPRQSPGAVVGSAVGPRAPLRVRLLKTLLALAVAVVLGLVPLRHLLTLSSDEAVVDAPIYNVTSPGTGIVEGSPVLVGAPVTSGTVIARIAAPDGSIIPVKAATDGKVWDIAVVRGMSIATGSVVAHVAACWARSVTALVSGAVYDRLRPGMSARFNFLGEDAYFDGTVANLLGHSVREGFATTPAPAPDSFRVVVSIPGLEEIPSCAIGRRGNVIFNAPPR